jgi:hypothetical protein
MTAMLNPGAAGRVSRIGESYDGRAEGASVLAVIRALGVSAAATGAALGPTIEATTPGSPSPARVEPATPLETLGVSRAATPAPTAVFGGFLDGIQRSRVAGHVRGTIPVVHGTVAAAIRVRQDRTLHTWGDGPVMGRAVFVPVALVDAETITRIGAAGFEVVDTSPGPEANGHPQELVAAARVAVQQRRETAEASLAEAWCKGESAPLYVDGGIGGFTDASRHQLIVGVVKSHRTLYANAQDIPAIVGLRVGERSGAFTAPSRRRTPVASWYLRLRESAGGDPLDGLVRVEIAHATFTSARADEVSGWVLHERAPVALPDSRWRVMAYGIRDCEEYLRAIIG